jgi:predicted helicase
MEIDTRWPCAHTLTDFTEKQHFLNTVYERFFQGYSVKTADTHGIVYTPQPIVDFMCASVAEVLETEFGLSLGSLGVNILDPCTGTGNFIVNLLNRITKKDLSRVYREQMFANEVMLLPYYIAAMNIEHAYFELTGHYEPFEGLCFADTLDMAEHAQGKLGFMTEANTERVQRQKTTPITVVIGNPPYNAWQLNENDNNKNRTYKVVEGRIRQTYAKDSVATNKNSLSDAYVKFFRWATDRISANGNGIVCIVSNNGFLSGVAFDGFRRNLALDFDSIYHFDLKGNARTSGERRRQEGGNIFSDQIRVGIGITLLVRHQQRASSRIHYHVVKDYWTAEEKSQYLESLRSVSGVPWGELHADDRHAWLVPKNADQFAAFLPLGNKDFRSSAKMEGEAVFKIFSVGVKTNRDEVVYDFRDHELTDRIKLFIESYNGEVDRYKRSGGKADPDEFVNYDKLKWSRDLKADLKRLRYATFDKASIREALYRPFCVKRLFFDRILNEEVYSLYQVHPNGQAAQENPVIALTNLGSEKPFMVLAADSVVDVHLVGAGSAAQCFPFYIYDADGTNRRENITDWSLNQFRTHYADATITKWDVFYYVYGLLHHPGYRTKFADNLKRDLPRIPFAPDFRAFAAAGKELARLHLDYEQLAPFPLKWVEAEGVPLSYKVEDKMRLSKDKTAVRVNPSLTLEGVPPETFLYRLGNRSALDWVIDQYQVSEDKRSGIRSDPNRPDDPEYIVRLVGQVIQVSVETVKIVANLPERYAE